MSRPSDYMGKVRAKRPLVQCMTNYVTVNDCANACLCCGGTPVMTDAAEDVAEMVSIASALVLNIGTLNSRTVDSMEAAGRAANKAGIPVLLDPVGVGATRYRTETAFRLLERVDIAVIKGNHGEIGVLSGNGGQVRGVDSMGSKDPKSAAEKLASEFGCAVASTGEVDYVFRGGSGVELRNGHPLLGTVSGTGCMLSAVAGAYIGACGVSLESLSASLLVFSISSEYAATKCEGPGTFKPAFLDAIYNLDAERLDTRVQIRNL